MESQGEREPGVLEMDVGLVESMVQDENPEQEMLVVQDELPQPNPEPEMGAAAAAVYDTSPPPLRQNPPILAESAQSSAPDMAQLFAMLAGVNATMQQMNNKIDGSTNGMKDEMEKMRGEMQQMGRCLQAGIMAPPRAGTNELGGSATAVRPAVGAGEEKIIWETCWASSVRVTEEATVTVREKLKGVTETCETRHVETAESIKCTETREIKGELDGVKETEDEHTHTHTEVVEDNGGELAERVGTRCGQPGGLLRERGEVVCPLEATHDQVSSVVPRGVEGASAVNGCTRSLGV